MPDVDISEPRNLVATRLQTEQMTIPHTKGQTLYYAVTALDRYGNESKAIELPETAQKAAGMVRPLTPNDTKIPPFYYLMTKKERKKMGY